MQQIAFPAATVTMPLRWLAPDRAGVAHAFGSRPQERAVCGVEPFDERYRWPTQSRCEDCLVVTGAEQGPAGAHHRERRARPGREPLVTAVAQVPRDPEIELAWAAWAAAMVVADEQKRKDTYELERLVHARLAEIAPSKVSASPIGEQRIHLEPFVARMALWHALGYRAADWAEARGGKRGAPWPTIVALEEEELATELAKAIALSFRDAYGYHIPWTGLAIELGIELPAPPPAKPARAKKAAG